MAIETFKFNGIALPYWQDIHPSERMVEMSIGYNFFIDRLTTYKQALDVGASLDKHFDDLTAGVTHDAVDWFEVRPGVINEDIRTFDPWCKYDLIVSISTLEHVGGAEYHDGTPRALDYKGGVVAVKRCIDLLAPGGELLFTIPKGWNNPYLEEQLFDSLSYLNKTYMKRTGLATWVQTDNPEDIADCDYDNPYKFANAIYVVTYTNDN